MFWTIERARPCIERARRDASTGWITMSSPSFPTVTSTGSSRDISPLGPFTCTWFPLMVIVTPFGVDTGSFPTRDSLMCCASDIATTPQIERLDRSESRESVERGEHFATDVLIARGGATQHPVRGRKDGETESVAYFGDLAGLHILAASWCALAGQLLQHRFTIEVLELELERVVTAIGLGILYTGEVARFHQDLG